MKDKFSDYKYWQGFNCIDQQQKKYRFKNGYGASVVKTHESTTSLRELDLYELAVLKNDKICFDTPLTNDTIKLLTIHAVERLLKKIKELEQ